MGNGLNEPGENFIGTRVHTMGGIQRSNREQMEHDGVQPRAGQKLRPQRIKRRCSLPHIACG